MPVKNIRYRTKNYIANENRIHADAKIHPEIMKGLREIARAERKTVSWVIEEALSDYFGIAVLLRKLKYKPKPTYRDIVGKKRSA